MSDTGKKKNSNARSSVDVNTNASEQAVVGESTSAVAKVKVQSHSSVLSGQVGLGLGVVEVGRMGKILERTPSFATRVFSKDEQTFCNSKTLPATQYAMHFAAKQAVLKALGTSPTQGIGVRDIEVCRNAKGKPYAKLTGRAKEIADEKNIEEMPISLSYTHTEAVGCAIAITKESQVKAHRKNQLDPMDELVQQFRQTRSMLDDIENSDKSYK